MYQLLQREMYTGNKTNRSKLDLTLNETILKQEEWNNNNSENE